MFHGNVFEFFRNTNLDARNYFSPERAEFSQNQPGGTIGGPLKRGKIFFFGDYQATRTTQGIETGNISVPSLAQRTGDFSDVADQLTGTVNGSYLGESARAEARVRRVGGRAVLHAGLHDDGAVRLSQRADSAAGVVDAGAADAAVRAVAECRRRTPCRPARFRRRFATTKARSGSTATRGCSGC